MRHDAIEAGVVVLQRREGSVEAVADVLVQIVAQLGPAGLGRDVEGAGVVLGLGAAAALLELVGEVLLVARLGRRAVRAW